MSTNKYYLMEMQRNTEEAKHITTVNRKLVAENQQLRMEIEIAEGENQVILKRNINLQNNVRILNEKMKKIEFCKPAMPLVSASLESMPKKGNIKKARGSIDYTKEKVTERGVLHDEISDFIVQVMKDVKNRSGPWRNLSVDDVPTNSKINDQSIPISLHKLNVNERESVFRYLLTKLHRFSAAEPEKIPVKRESQVVVLPCK
jgi:hypothetical protein